MTVKFHSNQNQSVVIHHRHQEDQSDIRHAAKSTLYQVELFPLACSNNYGKDTTLSSSKHVRSSWPGVGSALNKELSVVDVGGWSVLWIVRVQVVCALLLVQSA